MSIRKSSKFGMAYEKKYKIKLMTNSHNQISAHNQFDYHEYVVGTSVLTVERFLAINKSATGAKRTAEHAFNRVKLFYSFFA